MENEDGNDMEDISGYEKFRVWHVWLGLEDIASVILPTV